MLTAAELVERVDDIASPPTAYQRLMEVVEHPLASAQDIAAVVGEDPGLTARLLGLVNSAFFSYPRAIGTVADAVAVVGTGQLSNLALATSVVSQFEGVSPELVDMDTFWQHSLACGVIARALGVHRRNSDPERLFVAGLLHDIGSLVLYRSAPEQAKSALEHCRAYTKQLQVSEQEVFGFTHAEVGGTLLKMWNLPQPLQEAVAFHHSPDAAPTYAVDACIVHLADIIAHALELGTNGEPLVPGLVPKAWQGVGIPLAAVDLVVDEAGVQYTDAARILLGAA